jgi:hypothetical protein
MASSLSSVEENLNKSRQQEHNPQLFLFWPNLKLSGLTG